MRNGRLEILLVTSRETKRWVIPKGWPLKGRTRPTAARAEALEEAGVSGRMSRTPLGTFDYTKRNPYGDLACRVTVFALEVLEERQKWPERRERKRYWCGSAVAAELVVEEGLKSLIRAFALTHEQSDRDK